MTHATHVAMDSEKSKLAAHAIKKRFDELEIPIKLSHAYEALAIAHRYPNWATMKATVASSDTSDNRRQKLAAGTSDMCLGYLAENSAEIIMPIGKDRRHIHCFATAPQSRRSALQKLGGHAIRNGGSAVFIEPVHDEASKAAFVDEVMASAGAAGRRNDFFILDMSSTDSRIGNSCDILQHQSDDRLCAEFFLAGSMRGYHDYVDNLNILTACIGDIRGQQRLVDTGRVTGLTPDAIAAKLTVPTADGETASWVNALGVEHSARALNMATMLAAYVTRTGNRYPRLFTQQPTWEGPICAFSRPQILIVFVPITGSEVDEIVAKLALDVVFSALNRTRRSDVPHMLLINDVDLTVSQAHSLGRAKDVVVVRADQCPTPPSYFDQNALRMRSRYSSDEKGSYNYIDIGGEEMQIVLGYRAVTGSPAPREMRTETRDGLLFRRS